jgi:hypothetical protein
MRRKSLSWAVGGAFVFMMSLSGSGYAATLRVLPQASPIDASFSANIASLHSVPSALLWRSTAGSSWLDTAQLPAPAFDRHGAGAPSFDELAIRFRPKALSVGGSPHLGDATDIRLMLVVGAGLVVYQLRRKQRHLQPTPIAS